jgi:uncharacterized RDD family membrane protein YckC
MTHPPSSIADLQDDLLTAGTPSRRVAAWFIDLFLIALIAGCLWVVLFTFGLLTLGLGFPLLGVLPLVPPAYHFLFLAYVGATPGQQALGLVVCRNEDLTRPDVLDALVSTVCFYLTLAAGVIWLAAVLITRRHRALHDLASGLVVVRRRGLAQLAASWDMDGGFHPA